MKITSNQREVLAATDSISSLPSAVTATNNRLDVNATVSVAGVSTAVNQTNGSQLTQIVDAGGEAVTVTGGKLDVNATISGTSGGTSAIDNTAFAAGADSGTPTMGFYHSTIDTVTDGRTAVVGMTSKRGLFVNLQTATGAETGVAGLPLQVSLANTAANATAVKVDGSAVNQPVTLTAETTKVIGVTRTADGAGNLLTSTGNALDVNLKTSAASVTVSGAVTANAGSNLNTSALALDTSVNGLLVAQGSTTLAQTGPLAQTATTTNSPSYTTAKTNPLSTDTSGNLRVSLKDTPSNTNNLNVNLAASAATVTVSGTVTTSPPANASTNIAQINAVTPLMGNGITGTGSLRVTIASDNTAFAVNATLSAETTKVIGTVNIAASQTIAVTNTGTFATQSTLAAETTKVIGVTRTADGTGNLLTSNSTTYTAKFGLDGNLLGTLGTAFSTAGKVDIKGADGDVFVRQATASNLNATVVGTGTFVTQSTLAAETTKVIGVVRTSDGTGNLLTSNSTTYTAKFGLDGNLLGTLGTAFSTAGKVDVKGADGDVFVRQATGTNLHTVVDSGTITTVSTLTGTTTLTPGTGATNLGKAEDQASADADVGVATLAVRKAAPTNTSGTDGDYEFLQMSGGRQWVWAQPNVVTMSTSVTRPADGNAYTANDAFANSTSAPTAGGFTFTGAALVSGGAGIITDAVISASAGTNYNGEIWIFDQAVTATNDNAALSVSDSDILNIVGVIPFQTSDINAANSISFITGLNIGYTCVGTANLRFLVKILTAVTPASGEVLSVRIKATN